MKKVHLIHFLVLVISLSEIVVGFEFLSTSVAIVSLVVKPIVKYTYCKLQECCTENEIPANFTSVSIINRIKLIVNVNFILELTQLLETHVYGQPLVEDIVLNALKAHWSGAQNQKPLVLSFHGWPGGGKNYVTDFIIESLYQKGSKSDHVHRFIGRTHFPRQDVVEDYKVTMKTSRREYIFCIFPGEPLQLDQRKCIKMCETNVHI